MIYFCCFLRVVKLKFEGVFDRKLPTRTRRSDEFSCGPFSLRNLVDNFLSARIVGCDLKLGFGDLRGGVEASFFGIEGLS